MDILVDFITGDNLLSTFLKLFGIVLGLLYLFFSIIVVQQVRTMKKVVQIEDSGTLTFVSHIQVMLALLVVIFALFIL